MVKIPTLLFTLSKKNGDFIVQPFKGSGCGGQKRNKTMSACRIIHPASGVVAECQEERSYPQNQKIAFKRLTSNPIFLKWHKIECSRRMGVEINIEDAVDFEMRMNIKVEEVHNGKWVVSK